MSNLTVTLAAARIAHDPRKGTRDSKRNAALLAAATLAQEGYCAWCQRPLDADATGWQAVQLDRLASGRALGRCTCIGSCRCAYLPGNVVAAHRACHDPEQGARGRLTQEQEHALASAYAPDAQSIEQALTRTRRAQGKATDDVAQALAHARAAANALLH